MELRCGNGRCNYWLGEAPSQMVNLGVFAKAGDVTIQGPRDLRLCRKCEQVNVFVPLAELGIKSAA